MVTGLMRSVKVRFQGVFESKESKALKKRQAVEKLACILNQVVSQKYQYQSALQEYELWCWQQHNKEEVANDIVFHALWDDSSGKRKVTFDLYSSAWEKRRKISIEAYNMTYDAWELLKLYAKDARGNCEGYSYDFKVIKDKNKVKEVSMPYCNCEYVSSETTIIDNCIDDNCDTWGTAYGNKAQSVYFFYITDIKKYAVVKVSYWCM